MISNRQRNLAIAFLLTKRKRIWVDPFYQGRNSNGAFRRIYQHLKNCPQLHHRYLRLDKSQFGQILDFIKNDITPKSNNFRLGISPLEKLLVTLRYLATGSSFRALSFDFCLGESTVAKIIKQTLKAIINRMMKVTIPSTIQKSKCVEITNNFLHKWNFPNCLGALDGKHITMFAPKHSGSRYFNYKKSYSIILMALVDADYRFINVDVGAYGSMADSTIFQNSNFGKEWFSANSKLDLPNPQPLPDTDVPLPFVLVADEAFGLKKNIMRPYPGRNLELKKRIFNYRLSRARRMVESTFGICSHTWRILLKRVELNVTTAIDVVTSCCILHNFLIGTEESSSIENNNLCDQTATPIDMHPFEIRDLFANWCISEGNLEFQYSMI